jgi:prepilin-type processing-associated H-X9-DG protein
MPKSRRERALEVLVVIGIIGLLVSILLPSWRRWNQPSGRIPCPNHLRIVGQALLLYAQDHGGVWPQTLNELVATTDITSEVIHCDITKKPFVFVRPGAVANTVTAQDLVAYEPLDYHDGEGSNALFGDGHVSWLTPTDLKEALNRPTTAATTQPANQ